VKNCKVQEGSVVRRVLASLVMVAALGISAAASAEAMADKAAQAIQTGPPPQAPTANMSPAELNRLFDAMLVMQAQEGLSLSEQQYGVFLGRLRKLQDTRRRNQQERNRLMNELQKMTSPRLPEPAAEADVKQRLAALQELEARSAAEIRKAYNEIDEVLNPIQQARFRVLEEQTERRKLELVTRARLNNQQQNRANPQRPAGRKPGALQ
jgi:hypothetical protein